MECVPNFSEGRDLNKLEKIADCFRGKQNVKLLDYSADSDHNRSVITVVGEPEALKIAVAESIGRALELIDLTKHTGQHPRMGCVDVVPFIPIRNTTIEDADKIARECAAFAAGKYGQPFFLYEHSATAPHRRSLSNIRKGQFEGMAEKMKDQSLWKPDFGPETIHPTGGVTAIGARMPLIAYNINLGTNDISIAEAIVHKVRHIDGGYRFCRAMAVKLSERGIVQVSMNLTNYKKTSVYSIFEAVKAEASRYGVNVVGSELIGMTPMEMVADVAAYYLRLEGSLTDRIIEMNI